MVEIGDVANSYLAIKMLPDDVLSAQDLERVGGRMPPTGDFTNPNNQTILAWIAGAEFPEDGGGTDTTGDTTGDTDTRGGGVQMPTGGMLDAAEIQTIEDWINADAPL